MIKPLSTHRRWANASTGSGSNLRNCISYVDIHVAKFLSEHMQYPIYVCTACVNILNRIGNAKQKVENLLKDIETDEKRLVGFSKFKTLVEKWSNKPTVTDPTSSESSPLKKKARILSPLKVSGFDHH